MKPVRGDEDIPSSTHEGTMELLGVRVRMYRLDDGRTLIHADDFAKVLAMMTGEGNNNDGGGARSG